MKVFSHYLCHKLTTVTAKRTLGSHGHPIFASVKKLINMQNEDFYEDYEDQDYGYTAEELEEMTWDAMTDGQYGPYPGGDIDYDMLGF